jgi:RHS repeat-associated protein
LIGVKYDVTDPTVAYASVTGGSRTVTYSYDAVGNRTSVVDGAVTTTYATNNLNQYTSLGGTNYTYSTRGELTGDGAWTYTYDQEQHLIGASKTGTTVSYGYDVLGRRTSKTVNGVTTNYVYSGQNLIEERDGSGSVLKKYLYAGGLDHPVQVVSYGNAYYFTQDVLGNVMALTNASGAVAESYTYDVFGKPTIKDGSGTVLSAAMTPFLFTGREYDTETGLYHYRARAYHPELGRFLQNDPIDFRGGDTNTYRYVSNNPINFVDPTGLTEQGAQMGLAIGGVIGAWVGGILGGTGGAVTGTFVAPGFGTIAGGGFGATEGAIVGGSVGGTVGILIGDAISNAWNKESKGSGKERATDIPSWAQGEKPLPGESGKDFAERLLDKKYGKGNYPKGPGSEFSKLKKYAERGCK